MRRSRSITSKLPPLAALVLVVLVWQGACAAQVVPAFMLPSPHQVWQALIADLPILLDHARLSLTEAALGLLSGIVAAFLLATAMERWQLLYRALYPLLVVSQTVPTVATAPLLVLWMGFGMAPKVTVVALTTFFPMAVGLLDGYRSADPDAIRLLRAMGAGRGQIFLHCKLPSALSHFFAGLKVSASYAVVGAVIAEWMGGYAGLGVYMTRVRKAYAFDKMFAVILLIVVVSLLLMALVKALRGAVMPWERAERRERDLEL